MPAQKVRADYDQLGQIAGTFASLADGVKQTTQNVQSRMQTLQNGDWVGDSANTFYAEMQDVVLPAMKRLSDALQEAGRVTINIRQVMEQAERDAAGVFAATPEAAPKADVGGILGAIGNAIGDFVSGVFEEGKGMVEGIVNMVAHPIQTLEGLAFAVTHPDKLWDALTKPYVDDWNSGHPWKAIGRGALNVALLIGTAGIGEAGAAAGEGANAVGKVGELAGAASKIGEVGEAGETATLAARTAEAAELARSAEVAEVARGAEVAEAARGAELSEAARTVELVESGQSYAQAINGATRTVPLGFESEAQFVEVTSDLSKALKMSGIDDATIGVRGSSVTGVGYKSGLPFGPQSDIDVFIESGQLTDGLATSKNIPGFVHPKQILQNNAEILDWSKRWSNNLGRKVTSGGFKPGTLPDHPAIIVVK